MSFNSWLRQLASRYVGKDSRKPARRPARRSRRPRLEVLEDRITPAAPGALDLSFGVGPLSVTDIAGRFDTAQSAAVQADGKFIVAGHSHNGSSSFDFSLARYLVDGSLDPTFGNGGKVLTDLNNGSADYTQAVAVVSTAGGVRYAVAGSSESGGNYDFALALYHADGSLDTSFGNGGVARVDFGNGSTDMALGLAVQEVAGQTKFVLAGRSDQPGITHVALARFNADGSPDTSFDGDGLVITPIGNTSHARSVAVHGSGLLVAAASGNDFTIVRYDVNGSLDSSFGTGGIAETDLGGSDSPHSLAVEAGGQFIVAGQSYDGNDNDFALVRYNADGTPDASFGSNGVVVDDLTGDTDVAQSVAVQVLDGQTKFVVAGYADNSDSRDFVVARYNADGGLDASFGSGGVVFTDIAGSSLDSARDVAVWPDGKLVVVGLVSVAGSDADYAVARYNADGTLVGSGGGKAITPIGPGHDEGFSAAVQADGKLVVAGSSNRGDKDFALTRYNLDGGLDASFGSGGTVLTDFGGGADFGRSVLVQPDGKLVVAGFSDDSGAGLNFALARYHADGSLDTSFGGSGTVVTDFFGHDSLALSLAEQSDGKLVVAGLAHNGSDYDYALARYETDGSPDASFGNGGLVVTDLGGDDSVQSVVVQTDGKLVVAGHTNGNDPGYDLALARYETDGSPDTSFGNDGLVVTDLGGDDSVLSMVVQTDGKLVVAGSSGGNFALARYNPDGTHDTTFGGSGAVVTPIAAGGQYLALALQADGKLAAAGYAMNAGDRDFALVRYHSDGNLDTSFGSGGSTLTDFGDDDYGWGLAVQADGQLVVAGRMANGRDVDFAAARYFAAVPRPTLTTFADDTGADDGVTTDNDLVVNGTVAAEPNVALTVTLFANGSPVGTQDVTTDVDGQAAWTITTGELGDDAYVFTAQAADQFGNDPVVSTNSLSVVVDTSAPTDLTLDGFSLDTGTGGDGVTADNELDVQGTVTGRPNETINVTLFEGTTQLGSTTVTVNADGDPKEWVIATGMLSDGDHTFTAQATDELGHGPADSDNALTVTVDTVGPDVTVSLADGQADPAAAGETEVKFTVEFSEEVFGFDGGDVALTGGAFGPNPPGITITQPDPVNFPNRYTVSVSGMERDGTVTLFVDANQVTDAAGNGNTAANAVTVRWPDATNEAPVLTAPANAFYFDEDTAFDFGNTLSVADPDAFGLDLRLILQATNGTLTLAAASPAGVVLEIGDGTADAHLTLRGSASDLNAALVGLTFRPNQDYNGTARLDLLADDLGHSGDPGPLTDARTVQFFVQPVADDPVARPRSVTTAEDAAVSGSLTATDPDGDPLTFSLVDGAAHGTAVVNPDGSFTYTPNADYDGSDSFTYRVNDGTADSATATVSITVTPVNDAPTADDGSDATDEDTPLIGNLSASDVDNDSLTYVLVNGPAHGSVIVDAGGSFTYTPAGDYHGGDSFTFRADDGMALSNVATFDITVDPVNDDPVAQPLTATTAEDTALDGTLSATDVDADSLTFSLDTAPQHGSVVVSTDGSFTYTPADDFFGTDSFTYLVSDGNNGSATATVALTVTAVNDAPIASDGGAATDEDTPLAIDLTGLASDAETDGGDLLYVLVTGPAHGTLTATGVGTYAYNPAADFHGTDAFTFRVGDGQALSNVATFTVTVNPVNDGPQAAPDAATTQEDTEVILDVLANDGDLDGDSLTITKIDGQDAAVDQPITVSDGTATLQDDGTIAFLPAANFHGTVRFDYTVSDGTTTTSATVTVTVNEVTAHLFHTATWVDYYTDDGWTTQVVGDFDGDQKDDIANFHPSNGTWWVSLSNGSGFAKTELWADFSTNGGWSSQVVGDFNGDDKDDLANFHPSSGMWWVSLSTGAGFTTSLWADFSTNDGWTSQVVGDFNGDDKDDIANFHPSSGMWWVSLSNSTGDGFTTSLWADFWTSDGWTTQVVGDFNGDQKDDIANFHPSNGTWWVSLSTGSGFTNAKWADFSTNDGWSSQVVGDFNGDDKDDLANFHPSSGMWWVSLSDGAGLRTALWADLDGTGYADHLVGDFDEDGVRDDLASFRASDGSWWVSLGDQDAETFRTDLWASYGSGAGLTRHLAGDFDGDRITDVADFLATEGVWKVGRATGGLRKIDGRAIPDGGALQSVLPAVGLSGALLDVNVRVRIEHPHVSDLYLFLVSPSGQRLALASGIGGSGDDFRDTLLNDEADRPIAAGGAPFTGWFRPSGALASLDGEDPNGVWTLEAVDAAAGHAGLLLEWELFLKTTAEL